MLTSDAAVRPLKPLRWILLGVVAYLFALLLLMPADWAAKRLAAYSGVTPPALQGRLMAGALAQPDPWFGIQSMAWRLSPALLLRGALGGYLAAGETDKGLAVLSGEAGLNWRGQLILDLLAVDGRLSELVTQLNGFPLLSDLHLKGRIDQLRLSGAGCELGQGQLQAAKWSGMLSEQLNNLGPINVQIRCEQQALQLSFSSEQERALEGGVQVQPNGAYRVELTGGGQPELNALWQGLGWRKQGREYRFVDSGRLPW